MFRLQETCNQFSAFLGAFAEYENFGLTFVEKL